MARRFDLVLRGGTVVSSSGTAAADLAVSGERIAALGLLDDAACAGAEVVDARGMVLVPGGVDVHTHLAMRLGAGSTADGFVSGSRGALFGGTTTIVDYADARPGASLRSLLDARRRAAEGQCSVDFGLHAVLVEPSDRDLKDMKAAAAAGAPTFKVFTAYPGRLMSGDGAIFRALRRAREIGGLVCAHAENGGVIDTLVREALARGDTAPRFHALTRPPEAEAEAVARLAALAEMAGAPVYVVHLSAARSLDAVRRARDRGVDIHAETCPQYLFLNADEYERPGFEGARFVMSPPLRPRGDEERLWKGLVAGDIETVATDHCSFFLKARKGAPCKEDGRADFSRIPNGVPGIETRVPLLWDAVQRGRLSPGRFAEVAAEAPAKLMGLWPRKGSLSPGADADIVVIDPRRTHTIAAATHHLAVDYNPYEGRTVHGAIREVFLRGRRMVLGERFVGRAGAGRFIRRELGCCGA